MTYVPLAPTPLTVYACVKCSCIDVEFDMYAKVNYAECRYQVISEGDQVWCPMCGEDVEIGTHRFDGAPEDFTAWIAAHPDFKRWSP